MDFTKMFFGGALIGTLITAWKTIKDISWKICTIVLKKVVIEDNLSPDLFNYLRENYKYYYLHDRVYKFGDHYLKHDKRYQKTGWESFANSSTLFWSGKIPFYYTRYNQTS